jgi:hypothetical protein
VEGQLARVLPALAQSHELDLLTRTGELVLHSDGVETQKEETKNCMNVASALAGLSPA